MTLPIAASGSRVNYYYCIEDASGDIDASTPAFVPIRFLTGDLQRNTEQVESEEITPSRQAVKARQGTYAVNGTIAAELCYGAHDYLMQAALQGAWDTNDELIVGSTLPTVAILRRNQDTGVDLLYRHCRVSDMGLNIVLNRSAGLTFAALGESVEEYTVPGGATFAALTTSEMMVPTIGSMQDNSSALTYLIEYNLQLTNQMEPLPALFQRGLYSVANGTFKASGSMSAYQPDNTLLAKFIDETGTDHIVTLQDLDGNQYVFTMTDVLYTQLSDPVNGPGAHIHNYSFTAGYDGTTTVKIARVDAT